MTTKTVILDGDMKKDVPFITFVEQPIEDMILNHCHFMSGNMRAEAHIHRGWGLFENSSYSKECKAMAKAYEAVAEKIKELKKERESTPKVKHGLKDEI